MLAGKLPWKLPPDMKFFKKLTTTTQNQAMSNAVIMGRKTFESLHDGFKPLPQRINVVISSHAYVLSRHHSFDWTWRRSLVSIFEQNKQQSALS